MRPRVLLGSAHNGKQTMKGYGQFCPVAKAAELFCERWTPLILRDLAAGATRFSELHRGVPLMSPTLLSQRLKQLEAEGVIVRRAPAKGRSKGATYHLTQPGREFVPMIMALGTWGQRWARRKLASDEVDLSLLVWSLERSVRADVFPSGRTVVRIEFVDQPQAKRLWWFVNDGEQCELCLQDPGFDVDLYLACTLRDMIYIVRGDLSLTKATETDRLMVEGPRALRRNLRAWLNLGPITKIRSQRGEAVAI
jgi:DNA-binding HxlR family transcriptional regulator